MAVESASMHSKRRSKLPLLLRCGQLALFTLFFADTYVYSILDTLLGRYLGTLGITQEHMSLAYSIYGIAQLVGSIALLLLQSWPAAASIRLPTQYTIIVVTVVVALGSTLLMVLAPASYQLLLVARAIQGTMGAVYTIYAMTLLVQWFPPAWQMQAVAFMTAGQTSGDSVAPVLGAVLYDTMGIVSAYLTQTIICTVALGVLVVLGIWWGVNSRKTGSSTPLAVSLQEAQGTHPSTACEEQLQAVDNDELDVEADAAGSSNSPDLGRKQVTETAPPAATHQQEPHQGQAVHRLLAKSDSVIGGPSSLQAQPSSMRLNLAVDSQAADADAAADVESSAGQDQGAEGPDTLMAQAGTSSHTAPMTVWQMLRQWSVVCECGVVFWAQMLRAALDVLAPLAMYTTPTWVVGLVFLGEAGGAFIAPFLLDLLLVHVPKISTRAVQLVAVSCMAVSGPLVLLFHLSVPGAAVFFTFFGASHSIIEALVFKHLVDQVGSEESPGVLIATMSAFSLFYVAGFTVGAFVAGAPQQDVVLQQQLAQVALSGGMLLYFLVYGVLLRRKCIVGRRMNHAHLV